MGLQIETRYGKWEKMLQCKNCYHVDHRHHHECEKCGGQSTYSAVTARRITKETSYKMFFGLLPDWAGHSDYWYEVQSDGGIKNSPMWTEEANNDPRLGPY